MFEQRVANVYHFFDLRFIPADQPRLDWLTIRLEPPALDVLHLALQTDGVHFPICPNNGGRNLRVITPALQVGKLFEEPASPLRLLESPKLPPDERIELRILVDLLPDDTELPGPFQCGEIFS